ncbi:MAG TPA: nucleotidyltransferase domain-containing protein [Chitinivibrionales bacterium]|nr:nucleotidyltransferase domain-containing protein [Chitinivibrionales bacterium]
MKSKILQRAKEAVLRIEPTADIILYGSRARNDFQKESDWDFLVLVDGDVDYTRTDRIRHQLHEIEWDTGEILCAIVRSRSVWKSPEYQGMPLFRNIEKEGLKI